MSNLLISICIPAYNAAVFLEETLQSVKNQTYLNWELIVIEDGTDEDAAEDSQLPFKSSEYFSSISFVSVKPPIMGQGLRIAEIISDYEFQIRNDAYLPSPYLDRIWQPPRYS